MAEMDPEVAKRLHNEGATLIVSDVPEGTEFGIDYFSCNIGPRFKGIKMIPIGLHFIYYSAVNRGGQGAPRTGLFLFSKRQDVFVMRWDQTNEDVVEVDVNEEEKDRYKQGLQEMDTFLGPYPYEHFKKWVSLTNHITKDLLERVQPVCKKISSVMELAQQPLHARSKTSATMDTISSLAQNQETLIRFSEIPKQRYPDGASPLEISKYSMDSSYALSHLINNMKVYDAFEHWKKLLNLLCSCDEALSTYSDIFEALIGVLHFQVLEIPKDFFVDIVSANNFLTTTLQVFFSNLESSTTVDKSLVDKALRFRQHLTKRFNWDFESEPEEFAPVVVET